MTDKEDHIEHIVKDLFGLTDPSYKPTHRVHYCSYCLNNTFFVIIVKPDPSSDYTYTEITCASCYAIYDTY